MRRLLSSAVGIALFAAPSFAADLPMGELNPQPLPPIEAEADVSDEAATAEAADSRVRISNDTPVSIAELYASPAEGGGEADVLGGRSIEAGAAVTVDFANAGGECEFDLRAVFEDGTVQTVEALDACAVGEIAFAG
jgi:hypothetical protein